MIINVENDEMLGRTNDKALHIALIEQQKEIERLTAESTEWESKFYDEAKKVDKAIEYINNSDLSTLEKWKLQEILKGDSNE